MWLVKLKLGALEYFVPRVIRSDTSDRFEGVVHEVIGPGNGPRLSSGRLVVNATDTNRGQSEKRWLRDEVLLEAELAKNPDDSRTVFYLAQTYLQNRKFVEAYEMNMRRAAMGDWEQEIYMALVRAGDAAVHAELPQRQAVDAYLAAYAIDHTRAEALVNLAELYMKVGQRTDDTQSMKLCALYAMQAVRLPVPDPADRKLFIFSSDYTFNRWDLAGTCCWYIGEYAVGYDALQRALEVDPSSRRLRDNLEMYERSEPSLVRRDASEL